MHLGKGSFKTVCVTGGCRLSVVRQPEPPLPALRSYRAFDEETGIEVAWNKVKLRNVEERERKQLDAEVSTLGLLDHKNIIHFFGSWKVDKVENGDVVINFITELCTNNLRECAPGAPPSHAAAPTLQSPPPAANRRVHAAADTRARTRR